MKVGISQVDITPAPGVELSGFAVRAQPSIGVLDPLFAKALYLEHGDEQLLWVHCDVIGFDAELVSAFRRTARERWRLDQTRVMLSATHTHSGPGTLRLRECGAYDPGYGNHLLERISHAANSARRHTETCDVVTIETPLVLAIDRRGGADAHTDPRVSATGFRRANGTWAAVLVNHAIHPVALGPGNRRISADIPGRTAAALSALLTGNPPVLVTNGACGNLNPPASNVSASTMTDWGREIAAAVAGPMKSAPVAAERLGVQTRRVSLPLDCFRGEEIDAYVQHSLQTASFHAAWGDRFRHAVEHWRRSLREAEAGGSTATTRDVELMAVALGDAIFVGVNAEVFSRFTVQVRSLSRQTVYVVGYANGVLGYLPTNAAFAEGGYEVDAAHFFYGGFRFKAGALEQLTQEAVALVGQLAAGRESEFVA
jgi:neutral ceramidase